MDPVPKDTPNQTEAAKAPEFDEQFEDPIAPELELGAQWTFWEHYESFGGKQPSSSFEENMQKIACFGSVISFWQVWQNLPISDVTKFFFNYETQSVPSFRVKDQDKRVGSLSLFKTGIMPAWEDELNKYGGEFQVRIQDLKDNQLLNQLWEEIILDLVSKQIPFFEEITGVRVVDKSRAGQENFRFEFWLKFNRPDCDSGKAIQNWIQQQYVSKLPGDPKITFSPHSQHDDSKRQK